MSLVESFIRVFVEESQLDSTIQFYEQITGGTCGLRFPYPEYSLQVAAVRSPALNVLILAGTPEHRQYFEATQLTIRVHELTEMQQELAQLGAVALEPIQDTPTGWKMRYQHPDGLIVEYIQYHPS